MNKLIESKKVLTLSTTALASSAEQQNGLSPSETHVFLLHSKREKSTKKGGREGVAKKIILYYVDVFQQ